MRTYTAVIERDPETGVFAGYVPGFPGAHSQSDSLDELHAKSARGDCHAARGRGRGIS
jgi:predicted RNase H-like HicB family nuclease